MGAVVSRMGRFGEVLSLLALLGTLLTTLAFEGEGEEVEVLADDDWTEGWAAISFTFLVVVSGYIVGDPPSNCIHQGPDAWRCAHEKSTNIAPEPVYGVVMVGGKEKSRGESWPVETFPRDTCAVKIPALGTNYGEEWYFFTLSWISRLNTNRDDMLVACGGNVVGNKVNPSGATMRRPSTLGAWARRPRWQTAAFFSLEDRDRQAAKDLCASI